MVQMVSLDHPVRMFISPYGSQHVWRYLEPCIRRASFVVWRRDWNRLIYASGF